METVSVQTFPVASRQVWLGLNQSSGCSSQDVHRFVPNTLLHCLGCLPRIIDLLEGELLLSLRAWVHQKGFIVMYICPAGVSTWPPCHEAQMVQMTFWNNLLYLWSFAVDHDDHRPNSLSELGSGAMCYWCTWSPGADGRLVSSRVLHDNLEVSGTLHFCLGSGIWQPFLNLRVQAILQGFFFFFF